MAVIMSLRWLLLSAMLILGSVGTTSAFCVFNGSPQRVAVLQLPLTLKSYKQNIDPNSAPNCCNFKDCTGRAPGRCSPSTFCIIKGGTDITTLNADAVVPGIEGMLFPVDPPIQPGPGALETGNTALLKNTICTDVVESFNGGVVIIDNNGMARGMWDGSNLTPPPGTPC